MAMEKIGNQYNTLKILILVPQIWKLCIVNPTASAYRYEDHVTIKHGIRTDN